MEVTPYLSFKGNCEEAFKVYEKIFGSKGRIVKWGESPMASAVSADWKDKVMHAHLKVGDGAIMAGDPPPERWDAISGFSVAIGLKDPKEAERIFAALSEGGKIEMPLGKTFWSQAFGMVVDRFGIPWMVNCE